MTCDRCQRELVIGAWPFCPHPMGVNTAVIDDQIEGGPRVFETLGHDGVYIDSKSQWRREVAAREDIVHYDAHDSAFYAKRKREHEERRKDLGIE